MLGRLHTAAAVALIAAVPLGPLGMWIYAQAASPDRGARQRDAQQLLAATPAPAGAQTSLIQRIDVRAWDGEGLVPVRTYRFDYAVRLSHSLSVAAVVAHYTRELAGWTRSVQRVPCSRVSKKPGCAARYVGFVESDRRIQLDLADSLAGDGQTVKTYGVNVSQ